MKLTRGEVDATLSDAIVEVALKRAKAPDLKPKDYFMRNNFSGDFYYVFCLSHRIKFHYNSRSLTNMRTYLKQIHNIELKMVCTGAKNENDEGTAHFWTTASAS